MSKSTGEVLDRWNFRIETDAEVVQKGVSREKSDKEITREIQAIMRQVASCITYLPCLDQPWVDNTLAAVIRFEDKIKEDAAQVVENLTREGIDVYMLSGDKKSIANYVASVVGSPQERIRI